jgi:hypothetical protein
MEWITCVHCEANATSFCELVPLTVREAAKHEFRAVTKLVPLTNWTQN